jgi:hypothetical protein
VQYSRVLSISTTVAIVLMSASAQGSRSWQPLGTGVTGNSISRLYAWGDSLVVGGDFSSAGGIPANDIALWDGTSWSAMGDGFNQVNGIAEYDGMLVVAGTRSDSLQEVSYWHPQSHHWKTLTEWRALPVAFQGSLYGAQQVLHPYNPCYRTQAELYEFDGSMWSNVHVWGLCNGSSGLSDMKVLDGLLYAFSYYSERDFGLWGEVEHFDGATWTSLGILDNHFAGGKIGMANGQVFVTYVDRSENNVVQKWDGAAWVDVYSESIYDDCWVSTIVEYDSTLVIGGGFDCLVTPASVMSYEDPGWSALGDKMDGSVYELLVHDGTLIAAGSFDSTGTTPTPLIAQYVDSPVAVDGSPAPGHAVLHRNYPNPFNPATSIPYTLPEAGRVAIIVYAADGRRVRTLLDAHRTAGDGTVTWDGTDDEGSPVTSGVYFCDMRFRGTSQTRKLVLIK